MESIGYKSIPVTLPTQSGPMTLDVGITYVRDQDCVMTWDHKIMPYFGEILDNVDKMRFIAAAVARFQNTIGPQPRMVSHGR